MVPAKPALFYARGLAEARKDWATTESAAIWSRSKWRAVSGRPGGRHSPYCICECSHNDGNYCCSDCCEYRTEYCYTECSYNTPGFQYCSPCDDCEESEEHCFLECEHNEKWQVNSPCNECDKSDCEGCDYAEKKEELARTKKSATAA